MNCPVCGKELNTDWSSPVRSCSCGWGAKGKIRDKEKKLSPVLSAIGLAIALVLLWAMTITMLYGSYYLTDAFWGAKLNVNHPHWRWIFGVVWTLYIGLCYSFETPEPDTEWYWLIFDNPFSFQDDFERIKLFIGILMLPGKIVVTAITLLFKIGRG